MTHNLEAVVAIGLVLIVLWTVGLVQTLTTRKDTE